MSDQAGTKPKRASTKHKPVWMVLRDLGDGKLERVYAGEKKSKANEHAARVLTEQVGSNPDHQILVIRASYYAVLTPKELVTVLPKDAF